MTPTASAPDTAGTTRTVSSAAGVQRWPNRVANEASALVAVIMAGTGLAMIVLALATKAGPERKAAEVFFGLVVVVSSALLARTRSKVAAEVSAGLLPGDLALAGTLFYLGVAMPAFQHGANRTQAVGQFIAVVVGLVVGCAGLIYTRAPAVTSRKLSFAGIVRDGVLLITGTIVVAIATGQLANPALKPPKWNWISFLGITIPGMLILVGREAVKGVLHRHDRPGGLLRMAQAAGVELLLVAGLGIMIFGSNANLALGKNGFHTGLKGNSEGLTLWLGAAAFLVVVRGLIKVALPSSSRLGSSLITGVLYVAGVLGLIYGERAVQMGKDPLVSFGGASLPAALMLAGGVAVLIVMRPAARALDALAATRVVDPA